MREPGSESSRMWSVTLHAAGWAVGTAVILAFALPAFLWANMPQTELDHLQRMSWLAIAIGGLGGMLVGILRTRRKADALQAEIERRFADRAGSTPWQELLDER